MFQNRFLAEKEKKTQKYRLAERCSTYDSILYEPRSLHYCIPFAINYFIILMCQVPSYYVCMLFSLAGRAASAKSH